MSLKALLKKEDSQDLNLVDFFALELLNLHADGIKAQALCIEKKVTGTQEDCFKVVSQACPDFMKLMEVAVRIAPFDLESFRRLMSMGSADELDFNTLTKLCLLGPKFAQILDCCFDYLKDSRDAK